MREALGRTLVHAQVKRWFDKFQFLQPVAGAVEGCWLNVEGSIRTHEVGADWFTEQ